MAFVNEYISDEDIKNYEIEKVWLHPNPVYIGKSKPAGFRFEWTINRARDSYFMVLTGPDRDDLYRTCVLKWKGELFTIYVRGTGDGSTSLSDSPFKKVWELRGAASYDSEILETLKEALTTYGYSGMRRQIPNTVVQFKF